MLPQNPVQNMNEYGSQSQYLTGPSIKEIAAGVVPLDTLPADWWNWLWQQLTKRVNETASGMSSLFSEVLSVLQDASITPTPTSTNQLLMAIRTISRTIGSTGIAGAVRSSIDSGKVAIDSDGYMTPNGMGIPSQLNTIAKTLVGALNEVLTSLNNYKTSNDATTTSLSVSKAPNNHASTESTYGLGTGTAYGHLKITDSLSSEDDNTAASAKAVKSLKSQLDQVSGVASGAVPTGTVVPFAGANAPVGWLICDGQAIDRNTYSALFGVIGTTYGSGNGSTTFNVPDLRESNPVGIGTRSSGISTHDAMTLGQFQEHTTKSHNHTFTGSAVTSGGPSTPNTGSTTPTFTGSAVTSGGPSTPNTGSTTPTFTGTSGTTSSVAPTFTGTAVTSGGQSNDHTHKMTPHKHIQHLDRENTMVSAGFDKWVKSYDAGSGTYASTLNSSSTRYGQVKTIDYYSTTSGDIYSQEWTGSPLLISNSSYNTVYTNTTSNGHTHSVTASGTVSSHTHTLTPSGTVSAHAHTLSNHTHSVTASGTVSAHAHTLSSHTHSVTASGTISSVGGTSTRGNRVGMNYIIKL